MGSAKNEQRGNVLEAKVRRISLEDEEDEDTVCTPRVPKGLSPSSRNIPPPPRIPYSSSVLARHSDGRVDGTPRRHRVSRLSPSMEGDSPCASVSPWIQWGREEEWIKLGDTLLRRVCNRMIPSKFPLLLCSDASRVLTRPDILRKELSVFSLLLEEEFFFAGIERAPFSTRSF